MATMACQLCKSQSSIERRRCESFWKRSTRDGGLCAWTPRRHSRHRSGVGEALFIALERNATALLYLVRPTRRENGAILALAEERSVRLPRGCNAGLSRHGHWHRQAAAGVA